MATKVVTQSKVMESTLKDIDAMTQGACEAIEAMAESARSMLALDARSLIKVGVLLDEIRARAACLMNDINCTAENHGANWRGMPRDRELSQKLWDQHHALHQTNEVQHG